MEDQKKRILKASFGFLLVVTFLVVSEELFESWWASNASDGHWNDDVKRRIWSSIWSEFGARTAQA